MARTRCSQVVPKILTNGSPSRAEGINHTLDPTHRQARPPVDLPGFVGHSGGCGLSCDELAGQAHLLPSGWTIRPGGADVARDQTLPVHSAMLLAVTAPDYARRRHPVHQGSRAVENHMSRVQVEHSVLG